MKNETIKKTYRVKRTFVKISPKEQEIREAAIIRVIADHLLKRGK